VPVVATFAIHTYQMGACRYPLEALAAEEEEPEADHTFPWQAVVAEEEPGADRTCPSFVAAEGPGSYSSPACSRWEQEVGPGRRQRPKQKGFLDSQRVERLRAMRIGRPPQIGRKDCS